MSISISLDFDIAKEHGVNAAIVHQQIKWSIKSGRFSGHQDGWYTSTLSELEKICPITIPQIRGGIATLLNAELLEKAKFRANRGDQTLSYRPSEPLNDAYVPESKSFAPESKSTDAPERKSTSVSKEEITTSSAPSGAGRLAEHLADRIATHREARGLGKGRPKVTDGWVNDMRLLLERGPLGLDQVHPQSEAKIRSSIDAVFELLATPTGAKGFCWADQVQCPKKLRQEWFRLGHDVHKVRSTQTPSAQTMTADQATGACLTAWRKAGDGAMTVNQQWKSMLAALEQQDLTLRELAETVGHHPFVGQERDAKFAIREAWRLMCSGASA